MTKASRSMPDLTIRDDERGDMQYRNLSVRASSLDIDNRTIEADVSTENPVLMPDWSRMEMVPEVLRSDGAVIPPSGQVPFLDSHNRSRVSDQLGSVRDIGTRYNKLSGRLHFSESAGNEFTKVREGHVTDVSAGYEVLKKTHVPKGETKEVGGRSYSGPVNVVTKWRLREVSLTPIGADTQAKLRGLDPSQCRFLTPELSKGFEMNEALRKLLVSKGMDDKLTDDEAQRWLIDNVDKLHTPERKEQSTPAVERKDSPAGLTADDIARLIQEGTRKAIEEQQSKRAAFIAEVDALCELADMPELSTQARDLADVSAVRDLLKKKKSERSVDIGFAPSIRVTGEGGRAFAKDIQSALTMRAIDQIAPPKDEFDIGGEWAAKKRAATREKVFPTAERGKDNERWKYATPFQMAEQYLQVVHGVDTRGLPRETVAAAAWFGPQRALDMGFQFRDAGYHTTGNFANLTLDTINKSMMIGYIEAPSTWEGPMRRGNSVADFKNISRLRMGAIPNLPIWNDNAAPELSSFADAREYYAVESRSIGVDFSYRLLINDDMDALSKTPPNMGDAARRTVNAAAWSPWTANPTMSDGVALFAAATGARKRTNLTTGSATPTVATIQTLTNLMMQMRGENTPEGNESADILALMPKYIIGPSALRTTILQLVRSIYDPADANQKFNTASELLPVIEPLLDASSTTAFYLSADPVRVDTVEVTFLQGQENPVIRMVFDEKRLSQAYYVLQTFGVKALNHRGVQKHAGA